MSDVILIKMAYFILFKSAVIEINPFLSKDLQKVLDGSHINVYLNDLAPVE